MEQVLVVEVLYQLAPGILGSFLKLSYQTDFWLVWETNHVLPYTWYTVSSLIMKPSKCWETCCHLTNGTNHNRLFEVYGVE
jgi:hypothetical protein